MRKEKKVILINGENDDVYEQAIFVVRNDSEKSDSEDLIYEAEKIINNYVMDSDEAEFINLKKKIPNADSRIDKKNDDSKNDFETTVNYVMLMCCIVFILGLIRILI